MKNVIKPHYFVVHPIIDKQAVLNKEDGTIETTLPVTSIYERNGYEIMDHVFYINSEKELREYELLDKFAHIVLEMAKDYYCEDFELNDVFVRFCDTQTDKPIFGIRAWNDKNGKLDYKTADFSISYDEEECDWNCEYCTKFEDEENYEDEIPIYYFGFELF